MDESASCAIGSDVTPGERGRWRGSGAEMLESPITCGDSCENAGAHRGSVCNETRSMDVVGFVAGGFLVFTFCESENNSIVDAGQKIPDYS